MAKLDKPFYGEEATGGFNNILFYKRHPVTPHVSKIRLPVKYKTPLQTERRALFLEAVAAWRTLDQESRENYLSMANPPYSGFNNFVCEYLGGEIPLGSGGS
jgi:hypothetical protein